MAGKTTWIPMAHPYKTKYLLKNGDIIDCPELEQTPAGRKVRIKDRPEISDYASNTSGVIAKGVERIAASRGTHIWMQTEDGWGRSSATDVVAQSNLDNGLRQTLPFLDGDADLTNVSIEFAWEFQHPTLPFTAVVSVHLGSNWRRNENGDVVWSASVVLSYPDTRQSYWSLPAIHRDNAPGFHSLRYHLSQDFRQADPNGKLLDHSTNMGTVEAVKWFQRALHRVDAVSTVSIPDLRDATPEWLELEFTRTNFKPEQMVKLTDFLDTLPSIEEAADFYRKFVQALRSTGMTVRTKSDIEVMLSAGENISVDLVPDVGSLNHTVRLNLTAGTIGVICPDNFDHDAYHDWREAITIASLTGQQDELLEYAKAQAARRQRNEIDALAAARLAAEA